MHRTLSSCTLALLLATPLAGQTWHPEAAAAPPLLGFGAAAAVADNEILVARSGLVAGFPMPAAEQGGVHIFRRGADGGWSEAGLVMPEGGAPGDGFGSALAVSGNWLAVGANRAHGERGAVYVFRRDGDRWSQHARLTFADAEEGIRFGTAVAFAGDRLLVGVPRHDERTGAVVAYRPADGGWAEAGRLRAATGTAGDMFGAALVAAGDLVVVGAPGPVGGNPAALRHGAAVVFERAGDAWREAAVLTAADTLATRSLGASLLVSGDDLFVGAPFTAGATGRVIQFRRAGDTWTQHAVLAAGTAAGPGLFGVSLTRAGDDLLVGAPIAGNNVGAVHVLRAHAGTWAEVQKLTVEQIGLGMQLGMSVAAAGDVAVAGAPLASFFEGQGVVYARAPDGIWTESGRLAGDAPSPFQPITGGDARECAAGEVQLFSCQSVDLVSFLPAASLGAERGIMISDLWGWTDPDTGREFAIVGRFDGTAFVEVTDPANPVYLGQLPLHEGARPNLWRDMKVYRNHAYIVADGSGPHGVQVFDLTQLRHVTGGPVTFEETAHYGRIHSAHNIVIDTASGFAYTVGNSAGGETCGGALHMIDIREPANPVFAGCFGDPATGNAGTGYTHDGQCTIYQGPDADYRGRQICFNGSETALGIADVTDKDNPVAIANATYPNVGYTHQGWLSDDHQYFYVNDELDELAGNAPMTRTLIFDVRDLDDPVMVREVMGATPASDHNLYVKGRYMYQSNYVAGLRILDISDPLNPVEVGYFDTVPFGENEAGFAGSWSNYPYFTSGVVAVTSMREGLFLLRFNPPTPVP